MKGDLQSACAATGKNIVRRVGNYYEELSFRNAPHGGWWKRDPATDSYRPVPSNSPGLRTALEAERIASLSPSFSREELTELWNAIAQYIENHSEEGDVPHAARTASNKLDLFIMKVSA